MDQPSNSSSDDHLQRLNTNDSINSLFSRNDSSSPMTTNLTPCLSGLISPLPPTFQTDKETFNDALSFALAKLPSDQGQPTSINKLTTTPACELSINSKWCIVLVGLPAAGKSSICRNLKAYASQTFGDATKIDFFNAGHYRRQYSDCTKQQSSYFDFNNKDAKSQREEFARMALDHLLNSLANSQIDIGIFDATNSTRERRDYIMDTIQQKEAKTGIKINTILLHVKCTNPQFWRFNVEGKTTGPDYVNCDRDAAVEDFLKRAKLYQDAFEVITKEEISTREELVYMEIDNIGKNVRINPNGFNADEDFVFTELTKFVEKYYDSHGKEYEQKVREFTNKNLGSKV